MKVWSLSILLAGCQGGLFGHGGPDESGSDPDAPTVTLVTPEDGAQRYGSSIEATFEAENITLSDDPDAGDGSGHFHVYLDDGLVGETAETSWTFEGLTSGTHTIEVRLADPDNEERWGAGATATVQTLDSKLAIIGPIDGAVLSSCFTPLTLELSDFNVSSDAAFGDVAFGAGALEVTIDGNVTDWITDPTTAEVTQLSEGIHTVALQLVTSDGAPLDPPVEDELSVQVLPASPFIAFDHSPYMAALDSATAPITVSANATLDYHLYLDGVFYTRSTTPDVTLRHLAAGYHTVEARLTNGGSELPVHDRMGVFVSADRPDILVTSPGDLWSVASAFDMTVAVEGIELNAAAIGSPAVPGQGHWNVAVDGTVVTESGTTTASLSGLTPGAHVLRTELVNNDETPLDPPVYDEIRVTVN